MVESGYDSKRWGRQQRSQRVVAAASDGEERKMSAAATTWLGGSNKMRLQDDEGGGWAALEMKGGGWAAAFGRTVGKKKEAIVRRAKQRRQQGSSDSGVEMMIVAGEMGKTIAWGRRLATAASCGEERKKGRRSEGCDRGDGEEQHGRDGMAVEEGRKTVAWVAKMAVAGAGSWGLRMV
ncbi:hypothetical protein BHM03_00056341 [Ensete ventricosum]|nr:hypothetical protein BHM03_00056341 [Ensete ventricosum]